MSDTAELLRGWRRWTVGEHPSDTTRRYVRLAVAALAVVTLGFCARTGWAVLQDLQRIKLAEFRRVLDVLTVGDVVLCLVGYGIGKELLRAFIRRTT